MANELFAESMYSAGIMNGSLQVKLFTAETLLGMYSRLRGCLWCAVVEDVFTNKVTNAVKGISNRMNNYLYIETFLVKAFLI